MATESLPRISLCMIVRNEEQNLARCLESVHDLVHEIVLVDTGSSDRTCEIAEQFHSRIIKTKWSDDFAAARNMTLDHATGEWIFWLDADDRIVPNQRLRLKALFNSLDNSSKIYFLRIQSVLETGKTNLLTQARLFRANPQLRWTRRIHEQINPACEQLGYAREYTDIEIEHSGYKDSALYHRKINRDLRLLRIEYATNPHDSPTLYYLGLNLMKTGKYQEALGYLLQGYQLTRNTDDIFVSSLGSALIECLVKNGQLDQAFNICAETYRRFPHDCEIALQMAEMLFRRKQNGEAIFILQNAVKRRAAKEPFFGFTESNVSQSLNCLLARIYSEEKRYAEAEQLFQGLISETPLDPELWGYLGILYHNQKRIGDIEYVIKQAEKCPKGLAISDFLRAAILVEDGKLTEARAHCESSLAYNSASNWARVLLCQILYRQQDPDGQLENALRDLLRLDPLNSEALVMLDEVIQFNQMRKNQWTVNVNM